MMKDKILQIFKETKLNIVDENKLEQYIDFCIEKNIQKAIKGKTSYHHILPQAVNLPFTKFSKLTDFQKQKEIEKLVTQYIQKNFSFVVFRIDDKDERLKIESKIISSISLCDKCKQSLNWLGNYSPKEKIKESTLWLVNELYKEPFSKEDLDALKKFL